MSKRPLTSREQARLKQMNRQLYPARLRVIKSGKFQYDYRRGEVNYRRVVGDDLETAYERALIKRKEQCDLPVLSRRDVNLDEWYVEYAERRYPELSPTTVRGYEQCWNATPDSLKSARLGDLTQKQIEDALSAIQSDSVKGHTGRFLSILLGAAVKAGVMAKSPWHKGYRSPKRQVPLIGLEGVIKIIENVSDSAKPVLALAGFVGLRRGEIFALKKADFGPDPTNPEWVDIKHGRVRGYGKYKCDKLKSTKTNSRRMVPIPIMALPYIKSLLEGASDDLDAYLFPTFRSDVTRRIAKACRDAKLPKITLHDFRHLCGSHLMQEAGPAAAQAVLGHKQVSTTVDVYGHLSPLYLKRQMDAGSIREEGTKVAEAAQSFISHEDPAVAEFARSVLGLCKRMGNGNEG